MSTSQFRRGSITDKILSVFFAVVLIISLAPSTAYAQESRDDNNVGSSMVDTEETQGKDTTKSDSSVSERNGSSSNEEVGGNSSTNEDLSSTNETTTTPQNGSGSTKSVQDEEDADSSKSDEASYNVVANLGSYFADLSETEYLNKSTDTGQTGMTNERAGANATAVADADAHTITVTVPLDPDFYEAITIGELGTCDGIQVSRSGDTLTYVLSALPKDYQLGTKLKYSFDGAAVSFMGILNSSDLSLSLDFVNSGINPEEVFSSKSDEASSLAPATYGVTANLYALNDDGSRAYLGVAGPSSVFSENPSKTNTDGFVTNGARLMVTYDGSNSLDIWLDDSYEYSSLGNASDITAEVSDKNSGAGFRATFTYQNNKGEYHFTDANVSKNGKTYTDVYMSLALDTVQLLNPSNVAPASGVETLASGKYQVTANLFVPGEYNPVLIGYNAYMTSSDFPPTSPMANNATLTVAENGEVTLDVPILCTAFTLQKVDGGTGATVKSCEWGTNSEVSSLVPSGKYMTDITFSLEDVSTGFYSFTDSEEYPIPFAQTWNLPMYLKVDLANAIPDDDKEKTVELTNEEGSMKLVLTTTSNRLVQQAQNASFKAERVASGVVYDSAKQQIADSLTNPGGEEVVVYNTSLTDENGDDLDLSQFDSAQYMLVNTLDNFPNASQVNNNYFLFYSYDDGIFQRIDPSFTKQQQSSVLEDGTKTTYWSVIWNADRMGTVAVADIAPRSGTSIRSSFEISDNDSNTSLSCNIVDYGSHINSYYRNYLSLETKVYDSGEKQEQAVSAVKNAAGALPYSNAKTTAYSSMLVDSNQAYSFLQYLFTGTGWDFGNSYSDTYQYDNGLGEEFTFNFPVQSSEAEIYIVHVDDDGNTTAQKASDNPFVKSAEVKNGQATVTWRGATTKEEFFDLKATMLAFSYDLLGVPRQSDVPSVYNWTYGGEGYSYYAVVENKDAAKIASVPTASSVTYTGKSQTALTEGEGYTLSGITEAVNAGTYKAKATLKKGYAWSDGTTEDKVFEWTISPAKLTATYAGETIVEGKSPSGEVSVSGFVNGENELTAKEYVAPHVTYPTDLKQGEYVLTPEGGSAANYTFNNVSGTLVINKAQESEQLQPGEYTVTANLYVPGELNTQIPGTTAYLTNPNNPLGQKPDGYSGPFEATTPTTPMSNNAKLVVAEDGTPTLTLQVLNPVFTLQSISGCQNATITNTVRDNNTYSDMSGSVTHNGRITELTITLNDKQGSYIFNNCIEFPTLLGVNWTVPLTLDVDFSTVPGYTPDVPESVNYAKLNAAIVNAQNTIKNVQVSVDGSDVDVLDTWVTQSAVDTLNAAIELAKKASTSSSQDEVDLATTTLNAATQVLNQSAKNGTKSSHSGNNNGNSGGNNNASNGGSVTITEDGYYAQGTYTVSGNIWFDKSATGLPLNPHISNSSFPPKDPVSGNATMTVDSTGHAWVTIPVVIQSKVMVVNNVWGSGITYDGSSVTIDLGTPRVGQTSFNGTCTANITMGSLASTISGKKGDYTWAANWAVTFGAASTESGGGTIPASALAVLAGVAGTVDEASAEEAALEALESNGWRASAGKKSHEYGTSDDAGVPVLPLVIGALIALAVAGGISAYAVRKTRKNQSSTQQF